MKPEEQSPFTINNQSAIRIMKNLESNLALLMIILLLAALIGTANSYAIDRTVSQNSPHITIRQNIKFSDATKLNQYPINSIKDSNIIPLVATSQPSQELPSQQTVYDPRRPIWNLAHMVNSIKELDYRLSKGANAVEADVTFSRDGIPLYTYHGPPCDCWRHCHQQEDFNDYLKYVREITLQDDVGTGTNGIGRNLSLLFLDLKLDYLDTRAKGVAGVELATSIIDNLYSSLSLSEESQDLGSKQLLKQQARKLYLILSVNHVTDVELIYNFLHHLESHNSSNLLEYIGFDVGMNDDLQLIELMWKKFKNSLNVWQGDGFTNCFSPFYNLERLSKALVKRDNELGYPSKVYHWTIDLHDRIRESLMMGVDAVMTNHPERLVSILQEPEMSDNFRMAQNSDNPFRKITRSKLLAGSSARSTLSLRRERSSSGIPVTGGFFGSLLDVFNSWFAYVKEITFLSLPTTSRFMPKSLRRQKIDSKSASSSMMITTVRSYQSNSTDPTANASLNVTTAKQEVQPYEGPKWYTTMASNFLLSILKIVLPPLS